MNHQKQNSATWLRTWITLALSSFLLLGCQRNVVPDSTANVIRISHVIAGIPYVDVDVDGIGHVPMLLDTGNIGQTVLTAKITRQVSPVDRSSDGKVGARIHGQNGDIRLAIPLHIASSALSNPAYNDIGSDFFSRFTSLLFTKDAIYLNYKPDGIAGCGHYTLAHGNGKARLWKSATIPVFRISIDGALRSAIFDSGTGAVLVKARRDHASAPVVMKIPRWNGLRDELVERERAHLKYGMSLKDKTSEVTIDTPIDAIDYPQVPADFILGWPITRSGAVYINHKTHQECVVPNALVDEVFDLPTR